MESVIRAFLAIDLSSEVRRWLEEARSLVEASAPSGWIRWTDVDGIHLTLKFLGEIPARREEEIRSVTDQTARGVRSFSLRTEGLGCFPNLARPRVVWAGVRNEPALTGFQRSLEANLEKVGFPPERRAFSPHLTLGRVREGAPEGALAEIGRAVHTASVPAGVMMRVSDCCLFRSVLRPAGAEYSVLYRTMLSG